MILDIYVISGGAYNEAGDGWEKRDEEDMRTQEQPGKLGRDEKGDELPGIVQQTMERDSHP